jgi:hypothetical protein
MCHNFALLANRGFPTKPRLIHQEGLKPRIHSNGFVFVLMNWQRKEIIKKLISGNRVCVNPRGIGQKPSNLQRVMIVET